MIWTLVCLKADAVFYKINLISFFHAWQAWTKVVQIKVASVEKGELYWVCRVDLVQSIDLNKVVYFLKNKVIGSGEVL